MKNENICKEIYIKDKINIDNYKFNPGNMNMNKTWNSLMIENYKKYDDYSSSTDDSDDIFASKNK